MKALILAGGYATRLHPLTLDRAKPLLKIDGKPILEHVLDKIPAHIDTIVSTNKKFEEDFQNWIDSLDRDVKLIIEETKEEEEKLGAIGGINYVIEKEGINEDLMVIAGDNLLGFDMGELLALYEKNKKPVVAAHDIKDLGQASKFGVLSLDENGKIIEFVEKPENPTSSLVSTLCYILPPHTFKYMKELTEKKKDNAGEFIAHLVNKEDVLGYVFDEHWFDIGSFDAYLEAHKLKKSDAISKSAKIDKKSKLSESVFIGDNCEIKNSDLENTIVMDNCRIENSKIKSCIIDENCEVKNIDLEYRLISSGAKIDGEGIFK